MDTNHRDISWLPGSPTYRMSSTGIIRLINIFLQRHEETHRFATRTATGLMMDWVQNYKFDELVTEALGCTEYFFISFSQLSIVDRFHCSAIASVN